MTKPPLTREQLRQRISAVLEIAQITDEPDDYDNELVSVLVDISEGLDMLDAGSVPPMFEPTPSYARGPDNRYAIQKVHQRAVFCVEALIARGDPVGDAVTKIAKAIGRGEETIRSWRKAVIKKGPKGTTIVKDPDLRRMLAHDRMIRPPVTEASILKHAKADGALLTQLLTPPKKPGGS